MLKIGTCIASVKFISSDIAKVNRSKVKVTRSYEICAQKHQIYLIVEIYPCYRKSSSPKRMAGSDF